MSGWERVILGAEMRPAPANVGVHRRSRSGNDAFNHGSCHPCQCQRYEHCEENAGPFPAPPNPGDCRENQSNKGVRPPVAKPADVSHKIVQAAVLVLLDEIPNRVIEIKRRADGDRSNRDPDEPIQNGGVLHKSVPVRKTLVMSSEMETSGDVSFALRRGIPRLRSE